MLRSCSAARGGAARRVSLRSPACTAVQVEHEDLFKLEFILIRAHARSSRDRQTLVPNFRWSRRRAWAWPGLAWPSRAGPEHFRARMGVRARVKASECSRSAGAVTAFKFTFSSLPKCPSSTRLKEGIMCERPVVAEPGLDLYLGEMQEVARAVVLLALLSATDAYRLPCTSPGGEIFHPAERLSSSIQAISNTHKFLQGKSRYPRPK